MYHDKIQLQNILKNVTTGKKYISSLLQKYDNNDKINDNIILSL